jgi:hypothetical protein
MPVLAAIVLFVVAALVVSAVLTLWGIPAVVLGLIAGVAYLARARREDPRIGTVERKATPEPSGTPRAASGGAETTNRRVGQS